MINRKGFKTDEKQKNRGQNLIPFLRYKHLHFVPFYLFVNSFLGKKPNYLSKKLDKLLSFIFYLLVEKSN